MAFNAEEFLEDVTWERFDVLKKPELMTLAKELNLDVKHAMRKQEIKNMLIDRLVDDDLLDSFNLDNKVLVDDGSESSVKLKQLEIQREMEMLKMQMQEQERKEKMELEKALKQQELEARLQMEKENFELEKELKQKEIDAKIKLEQEKLEKQGSSGASTHSGFDATKNIRLVPKFEEKEVDRYFLHFEKIAESLKWNRESWTLLLQSVFVGKAREIYSSLSIEQCQNYDAIKKAVLKAYELVPEAYRQKFRSAKKESNQTHVEFARVQEQNACLIGSSFLRM